MIQSIVQLIVLSFASVLVITVGLFVWGLQLLFNGARRTVRLLLTMASLKKRLAKSQATLPASYSLKLSGFEKTRTASSPNSKELKAEIARIDGRG